MLCVPEGDFARAAWLSEHWEQILKEVPLARAAQGWGTVADLEAAIFPRPEIVPLDPACPVCGVETDDGSIERIGDQFRVSYQSCGHVVVMSASET
jgi:hypothetical protein